MKKDLYLPNFRVKHSTKRKFNLVFLFWGFNLVMLGRLIFSDRGIIEYIQHKSFLDSRVSKLSELVKENESLIQEINIIQNDKRYQKKIVRDQLGFLATDEYIIYFKD